LLQQDSQVVVAMVVAEWEALRTCGAARAGARHLSARVLLGAAARASGVRSGPEKARARETPHSEPYRVRVGILLNSKITGEIGVW
jgi:hypothetical protein